MPENTEPVARLDIELDVNGHICDLEVAARWTLADVLRSQLQLTGTHLGCEQGGCGACSVLVDGQTIRSCLTFAWQVDGARITTIEGISDGDDLHELQWAFLRHRAFQCGFCTPGMIMSILGITEPMTMIELRAFISGQVCRCTGYEPIIDAAAEYLGSIGLFHDGDRVATT